MDPNQHHNALNKHDKLHWYEIEAILGQGGFGITYLAKDTNLDQLVAIKEYLPTEFSTRDRENTVQPISENHTEIFDWGKKRFLDEAKTLAQFRHPNVVRVNSFFENNNTGYMVMEYEEGTDLGSIIKAGENFDEKGLLDLLLPIIDGLDQIHAQGFIHRDIKPANIFIRNDGSPVLIDFGSARQAIGGQTRTLTSLVTPGFAPFEQYHDTEGKQGPWTDIYSLGATCYSMITGKPPIDALKRGMARLDHSTDAYLSLVDLKPGSYSEHFLQAVDHALEFKETDRPQDVRLWRAELVGEVAAPAPVTPGQVTPDQETLVPADLLPDTEIEETRVVDAPPDDPKPGTGKHGRNPVILAAIVCAVVIFALVSVQLGKESPDRQTPPETVAQREAAPQAEQPTVTGEQQQEEARLAAEKDKLQQEQARLAAEKEKLEREQARLAEEEKQRRAELAQEKKRQEAEKKRQADIARKQAAQKKRQQELARKAEEEKRRVELAKQRQAAAAGAINLNGTYTPDQGLEELVLTQTGNRIKGTIGTNGSTLEGLITGNRVEFIFNYSRTGYGFKEGTGEFTISDNGSRLVGSRYQGGFAQRTPWRLTRNSSARTQKQAAQVKQKSEPAAIPARVSLSGTFVPDEGFEELVLTQQGDRVSGTIGTNGSTLRGTLEGNTLTFVFNYSRTGYGFKDGFGKFNVSADGDRLIGTRSKAGFPNNSSWNLTRK